MLVNIVNNKPAGIVRISNKEKEDDFLKNNPSYIRTDFDFAEDFDLYEYDGTTFGLVPNWEQIKADREAQRQAEIEANQPTLGELKKQKISLLKKKYDKAFREYLSTYSEIEIQSFKDKAKEAKAYMINNNAPTPYIDAMVGGDGQKKVELINGIYRKIKHLASLEGKMLATRDAIKACKTKDELDAIGIENA